MVKVSNIAKDKSKLGMPKFEVNNMSSDINHSEKMNIEEFLELVDKDPQTARMIAYVQLKNPKIKSISSTGLRFFLEYIYIITFYKTSKNNNELEESLLPILEKYGTDVINTFTTRYIREKIKKDEEMFITAAYFGLYVFMMYISVLKDLKKYDEKQFARIKEIMKSILQDYIKIDKEDKGLREYWKSIYGEEV